MSNEADTHPTGGPGAAVHGQLLSAELVRLALNWTPAHGSPAFEALRNNRGACDSILRFFRDWVAERDTPEATVDEYVNWLDLQDKRVRSSRERQRAQRTFIKDTRCKFNKAYAFYNVTDGLCIHLAASSSPVESARFFGLVTAKSELTRGMVYTSPRLSSGEDAIDESESGERSVIVRPPSATVATDRNGQYQCLSLDDLRQAYESDGQPPEWFNAKMLAVMAHLDAHSTRDPRYIGTKRHPTLGNAELTVALDKLVREPHGFHFVCEAMQPVGYASLWRIALKDKSRLFAPQSELGNLLEGVACFDETPGTYLGWISALRLLPDHRQSNSSAPGSVARIALLRCAERILQDYAKRGIFFRDVFVAASHEDEAEFCERVNGAGRHPLESHRIFRLRLMPWSLVPLPEGFVPAGTFRQVREAYQAEEQRLATASGHSPG